MLARDGIILGVGSCKENTLTWPSIEHVASTAGMQGDHATCEFQLFVVSTCWYKMSLGTQ